MREETLIKTRFYLQSIKTMFIDWSVRLVSEDWVIKITYKDNFIDFVVKEKIDWDDKEAFKHIKTFCFNAYFDFERDWKSMNSEQIWRLLGIKSSAVRQQLKRSLKKLWKYGKFILQER